MSAEEWERVKEIRPAKGERLPAGRDASQGELAALLGACGRDPSPAGARDAAMVALLYCTGMRRSELAGLDLADHDPLTGELRVRRGKGRKERLVYAVGGAATALADWLDLRGDEPGALFSPVNKGGVIAPRRMSAQARNPCLWGMPGRIRMCSRHIGTSAIDGDMFMLKRGR